MLTSLTLELSHSQADELEPLRGPVPLRRRRVRRLFGHALSGIANAFFPTPLGGWLHRRLFDGLELTQLEVELPGSSAGLEWPSIAFLSDLHAGHYMTAADLLRLGERLMELEPGLVCLGGDLINQYESELELLEPFLARLAAPLGVFAVPGNHDYARPNDIVRWTARLEDAGVRVLKNRGQRVAHGAASLWIAGVDDLTEGEPRLSEALVGRRAGEPCLLLSHHPDLFREASARGVDLQLSGHTHGGQIRLAGWAPMHHSRFDWIQGLHARGASRLYVGRGAGVTALPLRIGTRGEITLLRPREVHTEKPREV